MGARIKHVVITCSHCGEQTAPMMPSVAAQRSGLFCSKNCATAARNAAKNSKILLTCDGCGDAFSRWPSELGEGRSYCTKACFHKSNPSTFSWTEWKEKNKVFHAATAKQWRENNPDKVAAMRKRWAVKNKEWSRRNTALRRASIKIGKVEWNTLVDRLLERAAGRCEYCGRNCGASIEIDHVLPISLGGTSDAENLAVCCRNCNASKGAKHPTAWLDQCLAKGYPTPEYKLKRAILAAQGVTIVEV